jgi:hypothetical protein
VDTKRVTRRQLLGSVGLTAGASLLTGCGEPLHGAPLQKGTGSTGRFDAKPFQPEGKTDNHWKYVRIQPAFAAAEAYRQFVDGGCMYGLFAGIMTAIATVQGESRQPFPIHMMRYGEGGVSGWGSLCGTTNGGAAVIGLFELDKQRRENLVARLFSWYETTELPAYQPKAMNDPEGVPKTIAGSVLCHVSAGKWCSESGNEVGSQEMKERCRRLTADVAAKTVELLNANLREPCKFAGLSPEVKSCNSCHGKELHDSLGKMQCGSCHQQLSKKHPAVANAPLKPGGSPCKPKP